MNKPMIPLMLNENDIMYYVEWAGKNAYGKDCYSINKCWCLRAYKTVLGKMRVMVTVNDNLDTTVIRHVPLSRLFGTAKEAAIYRAALEVGEEKYERY